MEFNEEYMETTAHERKRELKRLLKKTNATLGICETLRMVYDMIEDIPDEKRKEMITRRLVDASIMAKNMSNRLTYYKRKYKDTTGGGYHNLFKLHGCRARAKHRLARKL